MNGILIRNAYMPKNCWDCSGRIAGDIQTFNEAVSMVGGRCPYLERIVDPREFDMHSGRHPDCPLSEVKIPHGRLIDADVLIAKKRKLYCDNCILRTGIKNGKKQFLYEIGAAPCRGCWIDDMVTELQDAPTIIEAEGNDE